MALTRLSQHAKFTKKLKLLSGLLIFGFFGDLLSNFFSADH